MHSNYFLTTDVRVIGLKSLGQEILIDSGTGIMEELLKHCETVH